MMSGEGTLTLDLPTSCIRGESRALFGVSGFRGYRIFGRGAQRQGSDSRNGETEKGRDETGIRKEKGEEQTTVKA